VIPGIVCYLRSYDVRSYLRDFYDDNVYFNNPADYPPKLNDDLEGFVPIRREVAAFNRDPALTLTFDLLSRLQARQRLG